MEPMINALEKYLRIRTGNYEDGRKIVLLVLGGTELLWFSIFCSLLLVYILSFHYFFLTRSSVIVCLHMSCFDRIKPSG